MAIKALILKTVIIFSITLGVYYFLFLLPQKTQSQIQRQEYFNLLQNRVAYVELIKLNPQNPNYTSQKIDLIAKIKETNKKGLEAQNKDIKKVMEAQKEILDKLFQTKTYEGGITLLTSTKSIKMLTSETNLLISLGQDFR